MGGEGEGGREAGKGDILIVIYSYNENSGKLAEHDIDRLCSGDWVKHTKSPLQIQFLERSHEQEILKI